MNLIKNCKIAQNEKEGVVFISGNVKVSLSYIPYDFENSEKLYFVDCSETGKSYNSFSCLDQAKKKAVEISKCGQEKHISEKVVDLLNSKGCYVQKLQNGETFISGHLGQVSKGDMNISVKTNFSICAAGRYLSIVSGFGDVIRDIDLRRFDNAEDAYNELMGVSKLDEELNEISLEKFETHDLNGCAVFEIKEDQFFSDNPHAVFVECEKTGFKTWFTDCEAEAVFIGDKVFVFTNHDSEEIEEFICGHIVEKLNEKIEGFRQSYIAVESKFAKNLEHTTSEILNFDKDNIVQFSIDLNRRCSNKSLTFNIHYEGKGFAMFNGQLSFALIEMFNRFCK